MRNVRSRNFPMLSLVFGAFSDREAVGLQLLYDFPRLQCELGRFAPSAGNGSLYAGDLVREPPTASRCLGGRSCPRRRFWTRRG